MKKYLKPELEIVYLGKEPVMISTSDPDVDDSDKAKTSDGVNWEDNDINDAPDTKF